MHSSRVNNRQQQLAMEAWNSRDGNGNGDGKGDALTFNNLPTAGSMLSIATASSSSSSSSSSDSASASASASTAVDISHQSRLLSAAFSSHGSSDSNAIPKLIFNPISLLHLNPPPPPPSLPTAITSAAVHLDNSPFISFTKDPGFAERAAKFSCFSTATACSPPPPCPLSQYFPWSSTNNANANTTTTSAAEIKAFCRSVDVINPQDLKAAFRRTRLREEDEDQDRDGDDNNNNNEDEDEEDEEEEAEEVAFITSCTATTKKRSGNIIVNGDPDHKYKLDRPSELLTSKGRLRKRKLLCGTAINPKDLKGFNNELERVGRNSTSDNSKENETDDKSGEDAVTSPPPTNYDDSISIDTNTITNTNTNMNTNYTNKSVKSIGAPEAPKMDYIHVRARRGQATDSHSLAERVRREKISERMKVLQDLVPGCNKAIGKAVMLDEIINYVQSLQQQVEFLSMKLAAVNRNLGGNSHEAFNKEMHREHIIRPSVAPSLPFSSENASPLIQTIVPIPLQSPMAMSTSSLRARRNIVHTVVDSSVLSNGTVRVDATTSISPPPPPPPPPQVMGQEQVVAWEDELQSVVQMGFGHSTHKLSSRAAAQGG